MSDVGPGGIIIPFGVDVDEGNLGREAAKAGRLLAQGVGAGADDAADEWRATAKVIGGAAEDAAKRVLKGWRVVEADMRGSSVRIGTNLQQAFDRAGRELHEFTADAKALASVLEAQRSRGVGIIDPREFALLNRAIEKLQAFQKQVRETNFNDPAAVRSLRAQFDALQQEATKAKALFQSSTREQIEAARIAARRELEIERQGNRERAIEASRAASEQKFIAQREQQEILSNTQRTNARRVQLTRFALESIARLERGLGATIAGIGRTASRALGRGYQDTLGRISASFSRNSSRIEAIERSSATSRINIFRSAQRTQERLLSESITRQTRIIQGAQAKANAGLIGAARRSPSLGAIGGGAAGLGILSLGLERFSNLERLTKQFTALTGSAEAASQVLEEVKEFARVTPFDLVGVADLAKGFLAIKTPLDQVLPRVRAIADAVALTGGGVEQLDRIQRAIGQVVSTGKLQGDELNQLAENLPGLNIRQILADQLTGGNVQALVELQAAGDISGEAFVEGFITGLQGDERLVGASEDLAKTLGGRLANLKEVVEDVGAAFIGLIAAPMREGARIATIALDNLSAFIKGEVSPAMQVLRTAIGGAATALGALLVAKVAGEAIKILAGSVKLLLTPFGAVLAIAAALGAGFAVMRDRSEEFREVTDRLFRLLKTTGGRVFEAIGDAVERVRDAFTSAKEPILGSADALERAAKPARTFISEIGTRLGDAIATTGRFLTDTFIPALADVAIFIGQNIGPAISFVVDEFGKLYDAARAFAEPFVLKAFERIKRALEDVKEIGKEVFDTLKSAARSTSDGMKVALTPVQRILEGIQNLRKNLGPELLAIGGATAIGGLVAGPIGALVAGIGTAVATLSPTIRDAIVNGVITARDKVVEVFRGIDWPELANDALGFVQRLGFIIGNVVSDRRFVAALGGIVAVAGVIAFKFVTGFVQGVISNLGELVDLGTSVGEAILDGINNYIRDNPFDAALIAGGLVLAQMVGIGRRLAGGLAEGFSSFRLNAQGGGDFLTGALFGADGPGNFVRRAGRTAAQAADEVRRQLSTVSRAAGGGGILAIGGVDKSDIDFAKREFAGLTDEIGRSQAAGVRLRTAFQDTFDRIRTGAGGIRGIFSAIGTGIGDAKAALQGQGRQIGSALGVGVAAGFGSALGGQALGSGSVGIGLGSILASSLGAGLAIGGPGGAVVGAAVGGIGLLTAAFTANQQAAQEAAEEVEFYRDLLLDIAGTGEDAATAIREGFGAQLREELPATIATFADLGITTQDFVDIVSLAPADLEKFARGMDRIGTATTTAGGASGETRSRIAEIREELAKLPAGAARDTITAIVDAFESGAITAEEYRNALNFINNETGEFASGQRDAADLIKVTGEAGETAAGNIESLKNAFEALPDSPFGGKFVGAFQPPIDKVEELRDVLGEAQAAVDKLLNPGAGTLASEVGSAINSLSGIGSGLDAGLDLGGILGGAQVAGEIESFRGNLASVVKEGLEDGASEAQIDDALGLIKLAVNEMEISPEAKALLIAEAQAAIDADVVTVPVEAEADTDSAADAGRELAAATNRAIKRDSLFTVGTQMGDGFARGLAARADAVRRAAAQLAAGAEREIRRVTGAQSPATVYIGIGQDVADGFSLGVINNLGFVESAGTQMGNTFADATMEALEQLNDRIADLRLDLFGDLLGGITGPDSALRSGQFAIRSLTDALAGPIQEAAEAGRAATRSLDFGEGLVNREAFADVVDEIKAVGEGLLAAGFTPEAVTAELLRLRQQALDVGAFLGFDTATIDAFFTALGLSASSLEAFAQQLLTDTQKLKIEAEAEERQRALDEAKRIQDEAREELTQTVEQNIEVNLSVPFGDPEAIALAVANRQAAAVRTR